MVMKVLRACIYKSVKTGLLLKSIKTPIVRFNTPEKLDNFEIANSYIAANDLKRVNTGLQNVESIGAHLNFLKTFGHQWEMLSKSTIPMKKFLKS